MEDYIEYCKAGGPEGLDAYAEWCHEQEYFEREARFQESLLEHDEFADVDWMGW